MRRVIRRASGPGWRSPMVSEACRFWSRERSGVTLVLDLLHVLERLWKAARVFHAEGSLEAELWVLDRAHLANPVWRSQSGCQRDSPERDQTQDLRCPA
jgi:hypothetical protein